MEIIGPAELQKLNVPFGLDTDAVPPHPFSDEVLARLGDEYLLVFTPRAAKDGNIITLAYLREKFGTDPAHSEPCMYNQDWYLNENFASKTALDGGWHLLRKSVLEDARAQAPERIERGLPQGEQFPSAITCAFTFFAWWLHTGGEKLWKNDFLWCSDKDHNGDRIYVGRYEDPAGINKNGFNIHRHLALRSFHSVAPEICP